MEAIDVCLMELTHPYLKFHNGSSVLEGSRFCSFYSAGPSLKITTLTYKFINDVCTQNINLMALLAVK